jgi:hypothetical protein
VFILRFIWELYISLILGFELKSKGNCDISVSPQARNLNFESIKFRADSIAYQGFFFEVFSIYLHWETHSSILNSMITTVIIARPLY